MEAIKKILEEYYLGKKLRSILEFFEDLIVLTLSILLFYLSLTALYDLGYSIYEGKIPFINLIPKFLYVFILIELFRLTIVYLTERRIDTSMVVKTTFIAILREVIIKAPNLKFEDYIGISVLIATLGSIYYVPKFIMNRPKIIRRFIRNKPKFIRRSKK
ncbi:MAG: phosphate-starvation-inducible PsiE family protein [Hydrogenothermaceae bacterium]